MPDPGVEDLRIIQGSHWAKPIRLELDDGSPLDTTGYAARMQVRADAESSTVLLDCTTANGRLAVGYDPPARANTTAYGLGQQVTPATLNGYVYRCTVAGTSGGSAPAWPTTIGATVTDGTVTWTCQDTDARVSNLRILLAPADTTPLAAFAGARYDLELVDTFGNVLRVLEGLCALSREISR